MKKSSLLKVILLMVLCLALCNNMIGQIVLTHPWQNLKVAFFGDSVTDPNNKAARKHYWNWLEQWLGITPYVYAVSGREWNDIPNQTRQLSAQHGDDVDAIVVFVGTNDFNAGVPIGRWYDETAADVEAALGKPKATVRRLKRTPSMDSSTYRGRINTALDLLKRTYPSKLIVLLTPLHRGYATFGPDNIQPSEAYQNSCGEYVDAYVESVKQAGNVWAVPVIDLNAVSGLNPMVNEQLIYFGDKTTDRLHPNDEGHRRLAQTLYWQLLTVR